MAKDGGFQTHEAKTPGTEGLRNCRNGVVIAKSKERAVISVGTSKEETETSRVRH